MHITVKLDRHTSSNSASQYENILLAKPNAVLHVHVFLYLLSVVGLLLALRPRLTSAGLLSELLQTGLQLQLLLAGLAELPRLLAVYRFQLAAQLPLLGTQLP